MTEDQETPKREIGIDKATGMPTEILDFGDVWGKWTVRGTLAEEDFKAQDECMTIDVRTGKTALNTATMRINLIKLGTVDSPHGAHPPTNVLNKLPSGMATRLLEVIKRLSSPSQVDIKN